MKIELYTCWHGLKLYQKGYAFGAWEKDSQSYNESSENFKILVDESAIRDVLMEGEYDVVDLEGVEVVDHAEFTQMVQRNQKFKSTSSKIKELGVDVSLLSSILDNPNEPSSKEELVEWVKNVDAIINELESTKKTVIDLHY